MELSEQAKKARREYMKEYRKKNKERLDAMNREWKKNNPDKVRENNIRYWERKAKQLEEVK